MTNQMPARIGEIGQCLPLPFPFLDAILAELSQACFVGRANDLRRMRL
jgi:hypothetical protein